MEDKDDDFNKRYFTPLSKAPLLEFLFFQTNQFDWMGVFLLEDMNFLINQFD
jgi:hypothetical protein